MNGSYFFCCRSRSLFTTSLQSSMRSVDDSFNLLTLDRRILADRIRDTFPSSALRLEADLRASFSSVETGDDTRPAAGEMAVRSSASRVEEEEEEEDEVDENIEGDEMVGGEDGVGGEKEGEGKEEGASV